MSIDRRNPQKTSLKVYSEEVLKIYREHLIWYCFYEIYHLAIILWLSNPCRWRHLELRLLALILYNEFQRLIWKMTQENGGNYAFRWNLKFQSSYLDSSHYQYHLLGGLFVIDMGSILRDQTPSRNNRHTMASS